MSKIRQEGAEAAEAVGGPLKNKPSESPLAGRAFSPADNQAPVRTVKKASSVSNRAASRSDGAFRPAEEARAAKENNDRRKTAFAKSAGAEGAPPEDLTLENTAPAAAPSSAGPSKNNAESGPEDASRDTGGESGGTKAATEKAPLKKGLFKALKKKAAKKPNVYEEKFREMEKRCLYLMADFENYKRRAAKERSEQTLFGAEHFILALVNEVLDDLDRAYEDFEKTQSLKHFKSGVDLIHKNLRKILKRFHVEAEDPTGKPFDPDRCEALSRQTTDKTPKDHVLATLKKAYTLHDKLIRPAQAIVAQAPDTAAGGAEEEKETAGAAEGKPAPDS